MDCYTFLKTIDHKISMNFATHIIDLARRYKQFHRSENIYQIKLWGLSSIDSVREFIENGLLYPTDWKFYEKHKHGFHSQYAIWYFPKTDVIEKYIKPLIENYTEQELIDFIWS